MGTEPVRPATPGKPTGRLAAGAPAAGRAENNSFANCASVATSGNPGGSEPPAGLLVGVGVVMELADFHIFEHRQRVVGQHGEGAVQ